MCFFCLASPLCSFDGLIDAVCQVVVWFWLCSNSFGFSTFGRGFIGMLVPVLDWLCPWLIGGLPCWRVWKETEGKKSPPQPSTPIEKVVRNEFELEWLVQGATSPNKPSSVSSIPHVLPFCCILRVVLK